MATMLHSPLIKLYQNKGAHGYTSNFENALRNAHVDYIFLSDQDDIWAPNKVSTCMQYLQCYDMVISDAELINKKGEKIADSYFKERGSKKGFLNNLIRFSSTVAATGIPAAYRQRRWLHRP